MAKKTIVRLVDDLDGYSGEDVSTVEFGLDGATYVIDLAAPNAERLRARFGEFVAAARSTGGRKNISLAKPAGEARSKEQTKAIRDWARQNGHDISDRGRLSTGVIEAFEEAHVVAPKRAAKA
ncbi:histone-like nucleoid-structuring protein Lsr2 [Actinokineospora enzanensis]|uniref:histone-like nucleoid-structuring protein Lsr2 n=1 Tax=Actinokineospora enzanensis TaxID=155975 RepID=UPI00035F3AE2|nr:Lsr2 family protein [Actinokineospora enzanensis]